MLDGISAAMRAQIYAVMPERFSAAMAEHDSAAGPERLFAAMAEHYCPAKSEQPSATPSTPRLRLTVRCD
jgi:hypothetical protein